MKCFSEQGGQLWVYKIGHACDLQEDKGSEGGVVSTLTL